MYFIKNWEWRNRRLVPFYGCVYSYFHSGGLSFSTAHRKYKHTHRTTHTGTYAGLRAYAPAYEYRGEKKMHLYINPHTAQGQENKCCTRRGAPTRPCERRKTRPDPAAEGNERPGTQRQVFHHRRSTRDEPFCRRTRAGPEPPAAFPGAPLGLIPESRHGGAHRALRLGGCLSEWTGRVPILNWLHWPGALPLPAPFSPRGWHKAWPGLSQKREGRSPWQLPGSPRGLQRAPQPGPAPLGTAAGRHGDRGPTPHIA